jgi:two-component system NtrC family sensor kinase
MRLVRRLVLAVFVAFLPVLVIIEYASFSREWRLSQDDARHDLALLGRALENEIEHDWGEEPPQRDIDAANAVEPIAIARWIPAGEAEPAADTTRIEVRVPVVVDGVQRGTILLFESEDRLRDFVRAHALRLSVLTGALLVVSLAISFTIGARLVGVRLTRLVEHARRVGADDLGGSVSVGGRDEIAVLAEQMNAMTRALESARASAEKANSERVQALSQLRHADRLASIGRLASAFAHELGTPLNVVLGRAKLILDPEVDAASSKENAEIIREQAQRMSETIRGVLGFARRAPTPAGIVDLCEVARGGVGLLEPLGRRRSVAIDLHVPNDVARVSGQRGEIEQIVANLVTNAIDASVDGSKVTVEVSTVTGKSVSRQTRAHAVFHRLSIRDQGPGIPAGDIARVFEPFYTTKPEGRGTGLGLWIVDGIVRDHGGWIEVDSRPGEGATFSVYLPAAAP